MAVWNLDDLYKEGEKTSLISSLKAHVTEFKSISLEDIGDEEVIGLLKKKEEIMKLSARISARASLKHVEDTSDMNALAEETEISQLMTDLSNELIYFSLWIKSLPEDRATRLISVSGDYSYYLKTLRRIKEHVLSEKEEKLINLKDLTGAESLTRIYDIITNKFTYRWDGKEISREELIPFIRNKERVIRKEAYDKLLDAYSKESAVLGEIYSSIVRDWNNENVGLRGYDSPISVRNKANDLSDATVRALIDSVRENSDVFHEYFKLKSEIVGQTLDRYDLYMSLSGDDSGFDYSTSRELVLMTFKEFGVEFYEAAKSIFDSEHIHSEIRPKKRGGAFCYMINRDILPYVMLNHAGKLEDVFTMMHELGHAVHDVFASRNNELVAHAALPLAETASLFSEMLLSKKLLDSKDKELRRNILFRLLEGQFASILRQVYFIVFEEEAHKALSQGASTEDLDGIYMNLLKEQFGPIDVPEVFKHEWKYVPHIYHSPFYCYSYAFGNLLVLSLYKTYEKEGRTFVPIYKEILAKGGSASPKEILKSAGVDIESKSFWESGFDAIREEIEILRNL